LEARIEGHLRQSLGYAVTTFLRTGAQLAAIAGRQPFPKGDWEEDGITRLYITFLTASPPTAVQQKLMDARTPTDDFHFHGSELYWLCRTPSIDSIFSGALLEKMLGMPATVRNRTTVLKLAGKYGQPD
jgi:uncharacterized protein (DUF1697 family)